MTRSRCAACAGLLVLNVLAGQVPAADPPTITSITPQAVCPGATTEITVRGTNLGQAAGLLTTFGADVELAPGVEGNGSRSDQTVYRVTVPAETPVGLHGVRAVTRSGVSVLKLFVVDDLATTASTNSNKSPDSPQTVPTPTAIDGTIGSLERRYFRFHADAGEELSFEVLARRIGSPLDAVIRLFDLQGHELAYSDDAPGLNGDAQLAWKFERAGDYLIEIRDVRYLGSARHFYRLRIGDFPCVNTAWPMGIPSDVETPVTLVGQTHSVATVTRPATGHFANVSARRNGGQSSGFAIVAVGTSEFTESEPNNVRDQATTLAGPGSINGRFDAAGDVDHYRFHASAGETWSFLAKTRELGTTTDVILRLLQSDGKQLAEVDDSGTNDAILTHKIAADGEYLLVVEDLLRRGGESFTYRIAAHRGGAFSLSASADRVVIPAGGTAMLPLTVSRSGYGGPIRVHMDGLPEGVTANPTVIGPGRNAAILTLSAAEALPPGLAQSARIIGDGIGKHSPHDVASIATAVRAAAAGLPFPPLSVSTAFAVSVGEPGPLVLRMESVDVAVKRKASAKVTLHAARTAHTDQPVTITVTPEKNGLPPGITFKAAPIPKGGDKTEIVFTANDKAAIGEFTVALIGTIKAGKQTISAPAPGVTLKVQR